MSNNSDAIFGEYADLDFDDAKSVQDVPALAALQASHAAQSNKTKITIRVDRQVLAAFKAKAAHTGDSYQAIMNDALKQYLTGQSLQEVIRETIRQELKHA